MCVRKNDWREEGGKEEGLEVGGNTLTPLKTFSPHPLFFLWRVIFRFTILIMMILERRGGGGGRRGEDDGRRMRLFALSFLFFFFTATHRMERGRKR